MSELKEHRARVPPANADAVDRALTESGLDGWAASSEPDGGLLVQVWTEDEDPPADLASLLAPFGLTLTHAGRAPSVALPGEPVELVPGVVLVEDEGQTAEGERLVVPRSEAFGDGRHPSTRLAAALLRDVDVAGARVLDLGCGTGVLGAWSARRGASAVTLSDLEDEALAAAREVCARNRVDADVVQSDLLAAVRGSFDVVVANLWAELALRMLDDARLQDVLPAGVLVLSGIARQAEDEVTGAVRKVGFVVEERAEASFWCALRARRYS